MYLFISKTEEVIKENHKEAWNIYENSKELKKAIFEIKEGTSSIVNRTFDFFKKEDVDTMFDFKQRIKKFL